GRSSSARTTSRPSGAPGPPAPEHETADGEAEAERADGEGADRERLPPRRQPLPPSERLLLLGRERLASALLAQSATRPDAEVEVVEDLGGVFGHDLSL